MVSKTLVQHKALKVVLWTVAGSVGLVVFVLLLGWLVQYLWNTVVVAVFDIGTITFWQAVGLLVLAKLFFGFGAGGGGGGKGRRKGADSSAGPAGPPDDEAFRRYWQEEGRQAYEAFLAGRRSEDDVSER